MAQLEKQKAINAELKSNVTDFMSVQSVSDTTILNNVNMKNGTTSISKNGKSLNEIVVSQDKVIKELTNQLKLSNLKLTKKLKN